MISADITKTKDSLNKAIVDIRQAFLVMVKEYSKDVAHTAIDKTPFGNKANDYYRLYSRLRYIPDEAGYAKGLGKTVILVLEKNNTTIKDRYLDFLRTVSDIVFDDLDSGIKFLSKFQ
jgi:hypothetical protein